jgi:phospholipase C
VHDVAQGQKLIKEVYEALRASPQWNEILLIITYDEHGGFHDHVPTPVADVPSPDGLVGSAPPYSFDFKRLGVRVPALLISPWIEKGTGTLYSGNSTTFFPVAKSLRYAQEIFFGVGIVSVISAGPGLG